MTKINGQVIEEVDDVSARNQKRVGSLVAVRHALNAWLLRKGYSLHEFGVFGRKYPCGRKRTGPRVVRVKHAELSKHAKATT